MSSRAGADFFSNAVIRCSVLANRKSGWPRLRCRKACQRDGSGGRWVGSATRRRAALGAGVDKRSERHCMCSLEAALASVRSATTIP